MNGYRSSPSIRQLTRCRRMECSPAFRCPLSPPSPTRGEGDKRRKDSVTSLLELYGDRLCIVVHRFMSVGSRSPLHRAPRFHFRALGLCSVWRDESNPATLYDISNDVRVRMHSACLTFLLGEVQHARRVVFGQHFEVLRTDFNCVLGIYIDGC